MNNKELSLSDFDILECPECGEECSPVKILKNGTVKYETHYCGNYFGSKIIKKSFFINPNGDLILK